MPAPEPPSSSCARRVLPGLLGEPLLEAFCAVRHAEAELFADTTPDAIAEVSRWRY